METQAEPENQRRAISVETAVRIAIVATAYVISARVGLSLDAVGGFATVVWPASGIALAAILLGGYRLWPAITIGALIANILTGATPIAAAGISVGNTAEALLGAYMLCRMPGFRCELDRVRDVLALLILAAALSTIVSATVGVSTLYAMGILPAAEVKSAWQAWWIGDSIGDLLAAPLILVWAGWRMRWPLPRIGESIALVFVIALAGILVFGGSPAAGSVMRGREYLLFPLLIWAALRFGTRGAVTSTAIVAIIAVVYTAIGRGPFVRGELHENLLALQLFAGVTGATFLFLGASIAERQKTASDLDGARRVAESANHAKANFLAVVSHELRTPLNAIMGYVDLLLLQVDGTLTKGQHEILDRVKHSQRHLLSLIEDVLGFAQVEAGRLSFVLQPVSVRDTFNAIEQVIGQEARKKAITLRLADVDPSMYVTADPDKLRQILLNLVTNAVKFTDPGGAIELTAEPLDDKVQIDVRDSGIGISPDNVARVFEPFFQVDQGGTRKYPGIGLGLSIVRDAVLAMNGDVRIASEPGKGTTGSITLPATSAVAASAREFSLEGNRVNQLDA